MISELVVKARNLAVNSHRSTNHLYDGQPYEKHLESVVLYTQFYENLIETDPYEVMAAAWMHDTIEDCRLTYNDVKQALGENVAELVYSLTNEKGRTRRDRANEKYYAGIRSVKDAAFIKICDRLANVSYSAYFKSSMLKVYRKENEHFKNELFHNKYSKMFDEIEFLIRSKI